MQFIEPFTASRSQTGNLQTIQTHGNFDDDSESDEAHEDEIDTSMSYAESSKNPIQSIPKNNHLKKKTNTSSIDELNKVVTGYFSNKKKAQVNTDANDPDMDFLKSLLPDIKLLNPHAKRILKIDMMKLVNDAIDKMPENQLHKQPETVDQPFNNNQTENLKYHHQETTQGTILYPPFDSNDPQNQESYQVLEHSPYWRPL